MVQLTSDNDPAKPSRLNNLGSALFEHFRNFGNLTDLNKSVLLQEDAIRLTPEGHPEKGSRLQNLGNTLFCRFEQLGDLRDLNKSVLIREDAVNLIPEDHPNKPLLLSNIGSSLTSRFQRLGNPDDINKSVSMQKYAVQLIKVGNPHKALILNSLGNSLYRRFTHFGNLDDLNKSVQMQEKAVASTPDGHPSKSSFLNNLGNSLASRFERLGDPADLNKAVLMQADAVHLIPEGHPDKPVLLNSLGMSLLTRFASLSDHDDLIKSVSIQEDAVHLSPEGHPNKPALMNTLGNSLFYRFKHLGDLTDLNKSVSMHEHALNLIPEGHPDKTKFLTNLGNSLHHRFKHLGGLDDLNKSVSVQEDAVGLTLESNPDKPLQLNNLGSSLLSRFKRLGNIADLNKSVSMREDAVHLTPDGHLDKRLWVNNLANSLRRRFEHLGDIDDLNRSVLLLEDVIHLTPEDHPDKPLVLANFGNSLLARFEHLGDLDNLNKSVSMLNDAVCLTPDGHPDKPSRLIHLGNALFHRFQELSIESDLDNAILHFSVAACSNTGPTHVRFHACTIWAQSKRIQEDFATAMDAYRVAMNLVPELAWLGLSVSDRHHHLLEASEIVRDAAAVAIISGHYSQAVEWLEQGRSVIWNQVLNLRTPTDFLKKLLSLSFKLDQSGTRTADLESTKDSQLQSLQSIADQAHQNALAREKLIKQIQRLEGFERFLLPKNISELYQAAQKGPVVMLNSTETRCDALILKPGHNNEVIHIPLTNFQSKDVNRIAQSLDHLVREDDRLGARREGQLRPDDEFTQHLSELWTGIVKPVLEGLAIQKPSAIDLPRIWWCPTGPFAFLPIHAAGLYEKDDIFGAKLSDYVISSYIPSLTALIEGFRPSLKPEKRMQLLAVAQPAASGQPYIPGTKEEIDQIQRLAIGKLSTVKLEGHMATLDSVKQKMRDSSWVHFACHGVQDVLHPTQSALLLAGGSKLTLSNIIQLALPHAELAFLSACQTAMGDKPLQEESVHLAAGMLSAGYHGVIATMWTIGDQDAPQVASDVYEHLFRTSPPDATKAAEALHLAVQKLQKGPNKKGFHCWVPFIHFGV
ncbi:CHAT domain-containing protein [Mycena galopus ATCC 62051]|nr:CHAT domain-containing protein [Mycena galopus ATCC 62051]